MAYLYFTAFAPFDHEQEPSHDSFFRARVWPAFSSTGLHRLWGKINHASARDYASKVKAAQNQ